VTAALPRVVIIEDEAAIRRFLTLALQSRFRIEESSDAQSGLTAVRHARPDLIILDLGLPDRDGLELLKELRSVSSAPVLVLSARDQEPVKVAALDAGADDYLVKPFSIAELEARLRVMLRHANRIAGQDEPGPLRCGELVIDLAAHAVTRSGATEHLTPLEFRLLAALARTPGRVLTHRQLLREVWGPAHVEHTHYLRIYLGQLRQKLEADPARPRHLLTELGVGYRFNAG
jgi:two-component system KDP operon response regulator KdpE